MHILWRQACLDTKRQKVPKYVDILHYMIRLYRDQFFCAVEAGLYEYEYDQLFYEAEKCKLQLILKLPITIIVVCFVICLWF